MRPQGDDLFDGLSDIVSNLLALFILLTIISLMAQVTSSAASRSDGQTGQTTGYFATRQADPITLPSAFAMVTGEGIGVLNYNGIVETLSERTGSRDAKRPVKGCLFIDPRGAPCTTPDGTIIDTDHKQTGLPRSSYEIRFSFEAIPQYGLMPTIEGDMSAEAQAAEMMTQIGALAPDGVAITFFVFPDGLASFAPLHQALTKSGTCFRWEPWNRNDPIVLRRGSLLGKRQCPA